MNSLKAPKGASIAVFGTGSVGLGAVMAARIVGAEPIIGVDKTPRRLELALQLGATHVIDSHRQDVPESLARIAGQGVDYVLEITGDRNMYRLAVDVVKLKGTVALIAEPGGSEPPTGRKESHRHYSGRRNAATLYPEADRVVPGRSIPL
jgi:aryl-alcohol dehydrogenase